MNPAQVYFKTVPQIVAAIKAQLDPLQITIGTNPPEAAFQRIELFDSENLLAAFQTLLISEQRICLIVPLDARWEHKPGENPRTIRRTMPVALLISDRVLGNRNEALYGSDVNPGAFALSALVLPAVTGQLIANPGGVVVMPKDESILIVKKEDRENLPGRAAVALELECQGGWMRASLDVSPTL